MRRRNYSYKSIVVTRHMKNSSNRLFFFVFKEIAKLERALERARNSHLEHTDEDLSKARHTLADLLSDLSDSEASEDEEGRRAGDGDEEVLLREVEEFNCRPLTGFPLRDGDAVVREDG